MANIKCDTTKVKEAGSDIVKLSIELNNLLEEVFKKIENMPESTGEWTGESAEEFVRIAMTNKKEYLNLKNIIESYGRTLQTHANLIENGVNSTRI